MVDGVARHLGPPPHWPSHSTCPPRAPPTAPLASLCSVWLARPLLTRGPLSVLCLCQKCCYSFSSLLWVPTLCLGPGAIVILRVDRNPFPPHSGSFAGLSWCPNPSRFLGLRSCHHREAFLPCPPVFKVGLYHLPCSVNTASVYFLPGILIICL